MNGMDGALRKWLANWLFSRPPGLTELGFGIPIGSADLSARRTFGRPILSLPTPSVSILGYRSKHKLRNKKKIRYRLRPQAVTGRKPNKSHSFHSYQFNIKFTSQVIGSQTATEG